MPQLIRPSAHTETVVTKTKQGECKVQITLDLNINLNSDGITVSGLSAQQKQEDKVSWELADFSPKKKVKFGKQVEEQL
jgi:hypothetical protein